MRPNLVFMDIRLPGDNGLELTRKIRISHPDIVIIILTSYGLARISGYGEPLQG
ncbi:MAG: response regulator [Thermodesulfobacteriota bacterium]